MRKNMYILVVVLFIAVLCSSSSIAWTGYTHKWICDRAGLFDIDCTNADNPKVQSTNPGINFRYHHCASDSYLCDARIKAAEYRSINTTLARGFAAHLYADSQVPVHWYSLDYDTCHKIFENAVEEKIRNSENIRYDLFNSEFDFSSWNVSMQCKSKDKNNPVMVDLYADNLYMEQTAKYVASEMHSGYIVNSTKVYDLTPVVYLFIALLLLVLTLFILMGMKNKEK